MYVCSNSFSKLFRPIIPELAVFLISSVGAARVSLNITAYAPTDAMMGERRRLRLVETKCRRGGNYLEFCQHYSISEEEHLIRNVKNARFAHGGGSGNIVSVPFN